MHGLLDLERTTANITATGKLIANFFGMRFKKYILFFNIYFQIYLSFYLIFELIDTVEVKPPVEHAISDLKPHIKMVLNDMTYQEIKIFNFNFNFKTETACRTSSR